MASILLLALLAMGPAATAADNAPAPAPKVVAVKDGDKLVCKREVTIGSNVPGKKVCKPKSQILAEQAAARDAAKDMTSPSGASSNN